MTPQPCNRTGRASSGSKGQCSLSHPQTRRVLKKTSPGLPQITQRRRSRAIVPAQVDTREAHWPWAFFNSLLCQSAAQGARGWGSAGGHGWFARNTQRSRLALHTSLVM